MRNLKVATVQFEPKAGDKDANLDIINTFVQKAAEQNVDLICFHEACNIGYLYLMGLNKEQFDKISEPVPGGYSTEKVSRMAKKFNICIGFGLIEKEGDKYYKAYSLVSPDGFIGKYHKIHAAVSRFLTQGDQYVLFDIKGWKVSVLICFDNNLVENVRSVRLKGAEILIMPHVTGGFEASGWCGMGRIDPKLWLEREKYPEKLRREFSGPKGREWLMKWLPTRAYENGMYVVFTNYVGMDGDEVRVGSSMIIDPFGEILAECNALGNDMVTANLIEEKLKATATAFGGAYVGRRKPHLYGLLSK